jgi:hypothetical protein
VLILLSHASATTAASFLPHSFRHKESTGTRTAVSTAIPPRTRQLQCSPGYRASSRPASARVTTISRRSTDRFLSRSMSPGRPVKLAARPNPAPLGMGIKFLSKDSSTTQQVGHHNQQKLILKFHCRLFSASTSKCYTICGLPRHLTAHSGLSRAKHRAQ